MKYLRGLCQDSCRILSSQPELYLIALFSTLALVGSQHVPDRLALAAGSVLRTLAGPLAPRSGWEQAGAHLLRGIIFLGLPLLSVPLLGKSAPAPERRLSFVSLCLCGESVPVHPRSTTLRDLGWTIGDWRKWLRDIGLAFLLMLPLLFWAGQQHSFQRVYPYLTIARAGTWCFVLAQVIRAPHMLGWEFLFRGYLLFGFERRVGPAAAIAVSTIPFALMHFGKPVPELLGSIVAGLALGIIALRARSFIPAAILHFSVAAALDLFALLH